MANGYGSLTAVLANEDNVPALNRALERPFWHSHKGRDGLVGWQLEYAPRSGRGPIHRAAGLGAQEPAKRHLQICVHTVRSRNRHAKTLGPVIDEFSAPRGGGNYLVC